MFLTAGLQDTCKTGESWPQRLYSLLRTVEQDDGTDATEGKSARVGGEHIRSRCILLGLDFCINERGGFFNPFLTCGGHVWFEFVVPLASGMYNVHCATVRVWTVFEVAKSCICLALLFAGMASPCLMWLWYHPLGSLRAGASCLLSFIVFYCNDLGSDSRSQVEEIINQFPFIDLLPCDRKSIEYFTNVYMYTVIALSFSVVFLDLVTLSGRDGFIFYLTDCFNTENGQEVQEGDWMGCEISRVTTSSSLSKQIQPGSQETVRTLNYESSIRGGSPFVRVIKKWGMDPKPSQIASDDWPWISTQINNENDLWTLS